MVLSISNLGYAATTASFSYGRISMIFAAEAESGSIGFNSIGPLLAIFLVLAGAIVFVFVRRRGGAGTLEAENLVLRQKNRDAERRQRMERRRSEREETSERRGSATAEQDAGSRREAEAERATIDTLPISLFNGLAALPENEGLPILDDESLLAAIEEANVEIEEDAEIRAMALKILVKFRAANAVEALSHMATDDPTPQLRARATAALAEYDHESVFPAIVLAGADPTREVRAAAARALFSVRFDRAHCWARLAEMSDDPKSIQIAKAAIEGGLAERSLERLIHTDMRAAYEAYALMVLLIRSGEIEPIIKAIGHGKDHRIKLALLHILGIERNKNCLGRLKELEGRMSIPSVIRDRIRSLTADGVGVKAH